MSEGSKFSYRIEFEADEDSLINTVNTAIKRVKPDMDSKLNEMVTKSLAKSIRKAIKKTGPIQLEVEVAADYERGISRDARRDMPVPSQPDTVGDLLKQTAALMERATADEISPLISSTIGMLISQVMGYLTDNPVSATRILGSATSSITTQEGRYGDLSVVLNSLSRLTGLADGLSRGLESMDELPYGMKEQLIGIMGRERGMEFVTQEMSMDQPDGIVDVMTVAKLLSIMGIEPTITEDIGDILRTEIAVALSEGGVAIAQFEPIVEEREQQQFERVIGFLQKEVVPHLTSLFSTERARLGEEFDINIGRVVDAIMKTYGGFVSDWYSSTSEIGKEAVPPVPSDLAIKEMPGDVRRSEVDISKIVEALNRVVEALYNIGETGAAREVKHVVGLVDRMRDHHRSEDHGG